MIMKITLLVKDTNSNQIVYSEEFFIKDKSQIPEISDKVADKTVELEEKFPFPNYEIEQQLDWVNKFE